LKKLVKMKPERVSLVEWEKQARLTRAEEALVKELSLTIAADEPTNFPGYEDLPDTSHPRREKSYGDTLAELTNKRTKRRRFPENAEHYQWQKRLTRQKEELEGVVQNVQELISATNDIDGQRSLIMGRSEAIRTECANLMAEQRRLQEESESLATDLKYFTDLGPLQGRLEGVDVLSEEFSKALSRVDECIEFLEAHTDYTEAKQYLENFRSVRRRSLASIKSAFKKCLENADAAASGDPLSEVARIEYRTAAKSIRHVLEVLELKCRTKEYRTMLLACSRLYLNRRVELLKPSVRSKLALFQSKHLQQLVRAICNLLLQLCLNEHALYREFFTVEPGTMHDPSSSDPPDQTIGRALSEISFAMYEYLRPHVIRTEEMDILCDIVMIIDQEIRPQIETKGMALADFGKVIDRLVADIQERLQYRAQIFIRDSIRDYKPSPEDLAYHELLVKLKKESGEEALAASTEGKGNKFKVCAYRDWNPVLERTLNCLSQVYRSLAGKVFEYLAYEAVTHCINNLTTVAHAIARKSGNIHGHLFLIKHLLILREQISPFEVDFAIRETTLDFSNFDLVSPHIYGIATFVQRSFPTVIESELDSKKGLEVKLKEACESFIKTATKIHIGPLLRLIEGKPLKKSAGKINIEAPPQTPSPEKKTSPSKEALASKEPSSPKATPDQLVGDINSVVEKLEEGLVKSVKTLISLMELYLQNPITQRILLRPILSNMQSTFANLQNMVAKQNLADRVRVEALNSLMREVAGLER